VHNLADGYFDQALEEFNLSLELYPECVPACFERGNYWYKFKKYAHAIEDYSKAIELNEKHAFAYYHRALALIEIEDYLSALNDLDQAIKLYSPAKFFMTRMLVENKLKNLQNDFRIPLQKDLSISFHSDYQSLETGVETLYQPVLNKLKALAEDRWLLYERRWLFLCKLSFQIRHL
jgi:tetratricopeptide (TPR) repeat protein